MSIYVKFAKPAKAPEGKPSIPKGYLREGTLKLESGPWQCVDLALDQPREVVLNAEQDVVPGLSWSDEGLDETYTRALVVPRDWYAAQEHAASDPDFCSCHHCFYDEVLAEGGCLPTQHTVNQKLTAQLQVSKTPMVTLVTLSYEEGRENVRLTVYEYALPEQGGVMITDELCNKGALYDGALRGAYIISLDEFVKKQASPAYEAKTTKLANPNYVPAQDSDLEWKIVRGQVTKEHFAPFDDYYGDNSPSDVLSKDGECVLCWTSMRNAWAREKCEHEELTRYCKDDGEEDTAYDPYFYCASAADAEPCMGCNVCGTPDHDVDENFHISEDYDGTHCIGCNARVCSCV